MCATIACAHIIAFLLCIIVCSRLIFLSSEKQGVVGAVATISIHCYQYFLLDSIHELSFMRFGKWMVLMLLYYLFLGLYASYDMPMPWSRQRDFRGQRKATELHLWNCGIHGTSNCYWEGHDKVPDWWSIRVLVFEMLIGKPPFVQTNQLDRIQQKIVKEKIQLPSFLSTALIGSKRLDSGVGVCNDIKNQKLLKSINCKKLDVFQLPNVVGQMCIANFDERWTNMPLVDFPVASPMAGDCTFTGFTYVRPPVFQKPSLFRAMYLLLHMDEVMGEI